MNTKSRFPCKLTFNDDNSQTCSANKLEIIDINPEPNDFKLNFYCRSTTAVYNRHISRFTPWFSLAGGAFAGCKKVGNLFYMQY